MIDGRQRLSNLKLKARIVAERNFRDFMAGKIDYMPAWNLDEQLVKEFDRAAVLTTAQGRSDA